MPKYEQAVFISYAWGEEDQEREAIVNQLDQSLQKRGLKIIRDKRDLGYKGSIRQFMTRIGEGGCVILVISDKYLRSKNCMFELVEIAGNKQFSDRIFPIILGDANIYDWRGQADYHDHWEKEKTALDERIQGMKSRSKLQGLYEELDDYERFRAEISKLTNMLENMNSLSPNLLRDADFQQLYDAIVERASKSVSSATRTSETRENVRARNTEISEQSRTIGVTTSPSDEPRTIHLSTLKELETHQSSLRKYVEGYLLLSERWDECGTARSKLEKGINKIEAGDLDLRDLGEIRSSLSGASMNKVLPPSLMFDDLKKMADWFTQEMNGAQQEVEKLAKASKMVSAAKMKPALIEALFHLDNSISTIKSLLDICGTNINIELRQIDALINGIVHSQTVWELPTATEYSTTIDRDRTSQATVEIGHSSFDRTESNATQRSTLNT